MYSFINNGYTNITRGDNVKPKEDIKPKGKTREKCGDCFYKRETKKSIRKELSLISSPLTVYYK